jgi:hypothetical protein
LIVLGVTATGRLHAGDTIAGPPGPTLGHPEASFIAAVPTFFRELISAPALGATGGAILLGIAVKAALFVGFQPPCPLPGADQRMQAWLRASALFGAAFLSIVLSYYQLGNALTQRHESLRQGLIVLALYTAARTIRSPFAAGARMTALAAALALAFAIRLPAIRTDLRLEGATVASRAATWRSGMTAGPAMTFTNAPIPRVASGWSLAPGAFQIDPARFNGGLDWKDFAILSFFGKQRLQVK